MRIHRWTTETKLCEGEDIKKVGVALRFNFDVMRHRDLSTRFSMIPVTSLCKYVQRIQCVKISPVPYSLLCHNPAL